MRFLALIGLVIVTLLPLRALAWSPAGHMVSGAIAYQDLLKPEQRGLIPAIKPFLYSKLLDPDGSLQRQTQNLSGSEADKARFLAITVWADLIRKADPGKHRDKWHYINWPFKPPGEPADVSARPPQSENILAAFSHGERLLQSSASVDRKATGFAWLLHLVGDAHQPLHTIQLFTREYPEGDRGGNEICVRAASDAVPVNLHMLWDQLISSTEDVRALSNIAAELRSKYPAPWFKELATTDPTSWAKESYEIAKSAVYMNGAVRGTPKGQRRDCSEVIQAKVLPPGYVAKAREVAERRILLAGYRLAGYLARACRQGVCGKAQAAGAAS